MKHFFYLLLFFFGGSLLLPNVSLAYKVNSSSQKKKIDIYTQNVYSKLDFKGKKKLRYETFAKAFYGYLNMREHGKLSNKRYLTICDFSLSSNTNRMWVIDVLSKKVVINTLVAHGMNTGEEYARRFSNTPDSHQSSLGFYVTANSYVGSKGYAMRLKGVDGIFNNRAFARDIVMHGADYVSRAFIKGNQRLGRSWGCPSVEKRMAQPIIDRIKNGSCLFIYHPTKSYLRSSFWLNNPIAHLPREAGRFVLKDLARANSKVSKTDAETFGANAATSKTAAQAKAPVDTFQTITIYKDIPEVEKLKQDKNLKVQEITIPKDQVTPAMKKVAKQRIKVIKRISKIIHVGGDKKKSEQEEEKKK